MKRLIHNNQASVIPLLLFVLTIFVCGALYTLFFIEIGFPTFEGYIPEGSAKTFIMMMIYAIPLIVIIIGSFALLLAGVKRGVYG